MKRTYGNRADGRAKRVDKIQTPEMHQQINSIVFEKPMKKPFGVDGKSDTFYF